MTGPTTVLQRTGRVLYWAGCGFAILVIGAGVLIGHKDQSAVAIYAAFCVMAFLCWLAGRALRYILAGE